ncbi:hypothetical protein SAMN05444007_102443 [Cribrihabitans marinus]|uniref:Virulence factor n=1 Tax=Cribrihabitans marinus TaxID=1227549 RepID=A0A1H6TUD0_9RHOB|nr:virulence factor SrfC family protein [Cribrihabitans marinus]GGH21311.1 virulence factor [Cribrihabitans marinus]SEI83659.1 hypothetical protein SAMN05444007_102443 [Cribrihabitans marinus]
MQAQDKLASDCATLEAQSGEALAWVEDPENADLVGAETRSLVRLLRRVRRRARRLGQAARTRMSVSVFGPSQAGKSFLVSVLARPESGPLVADFDAPEGQLDYIRQINPEGEGESTGLVTRFTMVKQATPEGFPVRLTLLGEADIARTLVNSFFMDGDRSEPVPEPDEIAAHLDTFRARAGAARPGLEPDDVLEIGEYVEAGFGREAYAAALRPFWDEAAQIAPGLSAEDRAAFFALLWGGHRPFSELYARLAAALAELGHAGEVFAGLDALVPRDSSIIDVKTLSGGADGTPLTVSTPDGRQAALPRSVICGLAAELVLPMRDLPSQIFTETDLLDFPGARNRFEQDLGKAFEAGGALLPELLLRGKVAYLFDRYVEMQEITSMLLCIPDSNMETVDLPGLVQTWIARTHGATAEQRAQADCVLFLVLTKLDKHLSDSAAEGGDQTRFDRRMQASLLEKFGKGSDAWVSEWRPGQPFDNCYWLRNPNFYVEGLIDYDEARRETRIRPEKQERLAELREGCLHSDAVQRHFADPAAAWDAALTLNDGGVSYLLQSLEKKCKPDSKLNQIQGQLDGLIANVTQAMAPFHVSDDVERRIAEKQEAAARVIDDLEQALGRHRFGALLGALMVDQDEIAARIGRVPSSVRITNAVSAAADGAPAGLQRPDRPARPRPGNDEAGTRTRTLEQFQADTALEAWIEAIKTFRDDTARRRACGLEESSGLDLVAELIHAVRRTRLGPRLATQLADVNFGLTVEQQAQPAAILGAEAINSFVWTLGMDEMPEGDRPQVRTADGGHRPIFARNGAHDTVADLPERPRPVAEEVWTDWVFALDALFVANAKDGLGGQLNLEQNLRLGRILDALGGSDG